MLSSISGAYLLSLSLLATSLSLTTATSSPSGAQTTPAPSGPAATSGTVGGYPSCTYTGENAFHLCDFDMASFQTFLHSIYDSEVAAYGTPTALASGTTQAPGPVAHGTGATSSRSSAAMAMTSKLFMGAAPTGGPKIGMVAAGAMGALAVML